MSEDRDNLKIFMLNIVRQIGMLDLDEMRAVNEDAKASHRYWDTIGGLLDPTEYRKLLQGGFEASDIQVKIVDHLIAIRELTNQYEARFNPEQERE